MAGRSLLACTLGLLVGACSNTFDRLEQVGKEPPLRRIENPREAPDYRPVSWPVPDPEPAPRANPNSLWQPGSRAFFKDHRASRVGDIVRVMITIADKAELDNSTSRSRDSSESLAAPSVFGLQNEIVNWLPGNQNPANLLSLSGDMANTGTGTIDREEKIETEVAAVVTQVLPNGNLVIAGTQEIRVNYEVRELGVSGIVRTQDINSDNTVELSRIAEARVSYGGRGHISDVQQPRIGSQVIDIISPF